MVRGAFAPRSSPRRLQIACRTDSFDYEQLQIGFLKNCPIRRNSCSDLIVKEENIWLAGYSAGLPPAYCSARIRRRFSSMSPGRKVLSPRVFMENESVFGQLGEPQLFSRSVASAGDPQPLAVYHEFRDWAVIRRCVSRPWGYRSPSSTAMARNRRRLSDIIEIGAEEILHEILADAFPGCQFYCENEHSAFRSENASRRDPPPAAGGGDVRRYAAPLRFAVALLSPRPPAFLAINEPEEQPASTCCPRWPG